MKFEYYVINENFNKREIVQFNIFDNYHVQEETEKAVKKYLRAPAKFKYHSYVSDKEDIYGFEGFCKELECIIKWEEWSRCEYEILVGSLFEEDVNKFKKIDCYEQCRKNIPVIAREVIYQYKQQKKTLKNT